MVDGAVYFDLEKDKLQRDAIAKERNELINMMLQEKESGKPTRKPMKKDKEEFHCDSL